MDEFLRMKLDVSKALQRNFQISHNATCFFPKKLCKAIFLICHKKGKGKFPHKDDCISYKGTSCVLILINKMKTYLRWEVYHTVRMHSSSLIPIKNIK